MERPHRAHHGRGGGGDTGEGVCGSANNPQHCHGGYRLRWKQAARWERVYLLLSLRGLTVITFRLRWRMCQKPK